MPWCSICRREYAGTECPHCGHRAQPGETDPKTSSEPSRPAHLAILEQAAQPGGAAGSPDGSAVEQAADRSPKRRLVSSAGPAVPIRKQANDSVPSTWMSRLEAARLVTTGDKEKEKEKAAPEKPVQKPGQPPPLKPQNPANAAAKEEKKASAPVGKPAHLLVAQLEAEDKKRADEEAQRVSALFEGDRSDEIAKVEIPLSTDEVKQKAIPNWVVLLVLGVFVIGVVSVAVWMVNKKPGPSAEIDPAVQKAAEQRRQAIALLEEGHKLALEGKAKADDAIKAYSRALELDPQLASAERGIAISYAAKENEEQAVEHYRRYLKLAPQATDADTVRKIVSDYEKKKKKAADPKDEPKPEKSTPAAKLKNGKHHGPR